MKVIFLQDVPKIAKAGDIKEVADGYGRNYLIPKQLAVPAKSGTAEMVEAQRRVEARRQEKMLGELATLAGQLEGKEITIKARGGAKDRLYGSITAADIVSELKTATGASIDKRKVELAEPIRQFGSYEVTVKLAKDITPKIKVTVVAEETG